MNANYEPERQRANIQRDLGRLEGKVDSILNNISNLSAAILRADADRDNLARDLQLAEHKAAKLMSEVDRKAADSIASMRVEFQARHDEFQITYGDIKSKLYWLGGMAAVGGVGVGAGAKATIAAMLGFHG
jgi:outer membrane murein-binding lipoprotein Lpp